MPKRKHLLQVRTPPYRAPRNEWRRDLHQAIAEKLAEREIEYSTADRLEVHLRLYLDKRPLEWHDVDNRLKDVLDALQGRVGGPKNVRSLAPIIPNDHQVFRVVVEKVRGPWQARGRGHLKLRLLRKETAG